jgi:CUG-BP- and ETR3-like factor
MIVYEWLPCQIFSPYGHVEDVYIARDELKQSRGMSTLSYSSF